MLNLILKDILIQKKSLAYIALYVVIFSIAFQGTGMDTFIVIAVAVTYQMVATACAYEDKAGSDIMWNSMPIKRRNIVLSKYLSVLVYTIIAALVYMVFTILINLTAIPMSVAPITLPGLAAVFISTILMNDVYFPVYFKFGYMRARVISIILFFVLFIGIIGILSMAQMAQSKQSGTLFKIFNATFGNASGMQIIFAIIVAELIFTLISYALSVKFYNNKEF
jgi:ABC-type transport system involved in multi-copper enzyme maturation permease subunit